MASFLHIINPYSASVGSDAELEQKHTLHSLEIARKNAEGLRVRQVAACFQDEKIQLPENIEQNHGLSNSLQDVCKGSKRKLPLLDELLKKGSENADEEYLIYTNMDIILSPDFYKVIDQWLKEGADALIINRRRIPRKYLDFRPEEQYLLFALSGKPHPGFDCFVFKKSILNKFTLGDVCIGIPHAENSFAHHLFAHSEYCKLITDAHLTLHIGMELFKPWGSKQEIKFNYSEFRKSLKQLYPLFRVENVPGGNSGFLKRHFRWLMNPSFHYPTMFRLDLSQWNRPRRSLEKTDKPSRKNSYLEWLLKYINFD